MKVPRLYHANSLLLPDGTIITCGTDKEWNRNREHGEYRIEVFTPPYLMKDNISELVRPFIKNDRIQVSYGQDILIESDQAEEITSVTIIRPSSVTHSLNTDQRCIELEITDTKKNEISVKMQNNSNIALPGYYMLFILNKNETSSKAKFIHLN